MANPGGSCDGTSFMLWMAMSARPSGQRGFELLHEQPLATGLGQGRLALAVPFGGHGNELRGGVAGPLDQGPGALRLPQRERTRTGCDAHVQGRARGGGTGGCSAVGRGSCHGTVRDIPADAWSIDAESASI